MEANGRQEAFQSLVFLADEQGYITFDDIMRCADDHSLSIEDFDWLSSAVTTRGILVYDSNPNLKNTSDTEYDDYSQVDYDIIYQRIIELCPALENFVTQVKNTLPPQHGELSRLKYQIVDGNRHARCRMIEMHLRIALRIALGRAEMYDVDIEETIGDACVGLVYAVDKYDPDTSGPFSSFASLWIFQTITRFQETQRPLMYYPVHRKEEYYIVYSLIKERGCLGCEKLLYCKEVKEIITKKLSNSNIECEYILSQMVPFTPLQDLIEIEETDSEDGNDSKDYLYWSSHQGEDALFDLVCRKQLSEAILTALDNLSAKEAEIIQLRYGFHGKIYTLEEIGRQYNLTRERIRQIEAKALRKLKKRHSKSALTDFYY